MAAEQRRRIMTAGYVTGLGTGIAFHGAALILADDRLYRFGMLVAVLAATGLICCRMRCSDAMLERARQTGYDDGYSDGCEVARPARVTLLPGGGALAGSGAAHQLRQ